MGSEDISLAVKPDSISVADANMQWGHFVSPSCSQKRENTAFDLVLKNTWGLLVCKLLEVVLPVEKGGKFGLKKPNSANCGQNFCSRDASVRNLKNFEKHTHQSKG